jgi:hypothetical protein
MQPEHVPYATYSDWTQIPLLRSSDSSESPDPEALSSADKFLTIPAAAAAAGMAAAAAGVISTGPAESVLHASPCRSFYCSNDKCRRQVQSHPRGIVCTTCMPSEKWRRCSGTGCAAVVHAVCARAEDLDAQWKCRSCSTKAPEGLPDVPASTPKAKEDCEECLIFESDAEMYTFLRKEGYRLNNTQSSGKTWECCFCNKTFYAKRMKDDRWSAPITIVHEDKCSKPVKSQVKEEKDEEMKGLRSVRYFHEFGQYPGLLEYIEILGCLGEIRTDQIQRAVRQQFNVHVSTQLLYRTAKNAHDEMFGSNISDIEELLKMSEDVGDEGGFLKLFTGGMLVIQQCIHCM